MPALRAQQRGSSFDRVYLFLAQIDTSESTMAEHADFKLRTCENFRREKRLKHSSQAVSNSGDCGSRLGAVGRPTLRGSCGWKHALGTARVQYRRTWQCIFLVEFVLCVRLGHTGLRDNAGPALSRKNQSRNLPPIPPVRTRAARNFPVARLVGSLSQGFPVLRVWTSSAD